MQDPLWEREGKEESESYKESYGTYYDGNSDHAAYVWRKYVLLRRKNQSCDCSRSKQMP